MKNMNSKVCFLTDQKHVWHEGPIFKLKQNGISGKLLRLVKDFLNDRKQRMVLN